MDCSIFGPHKVSITKQIVLGEIFLGSELVKKQLQANNFDFWSGCWAISRVACIKIKVASPATLDAYREGIRRLMMNHNQWTAGHAGRKVQP